MKVSLAEVTTPPATTPKTSRVKDAAQQFESLVLGQILKSAQPAGFSGEEGGGDNAVSDFATQQLSQTLASSGGIGLARMLESSLANHQNPPAADSSVSVRKL